MVKTSNGYVISKGSALVLFIVFIGSLVAVGLLVYFLADRPNPSASLNNGSADASTSVKATSTKVAKLTTNIRLPRTVLPRHYDVRLLPILEKGNFSILGRVSIDIECMEETDRIILHSADIVVNPKSVRLIINKGNINNTKDQVLELNSIEYETELEFLTIPLSSKGNKQMLSKGLNYTLSMDYVGNLNDQLEGFYRSSYTEDGVEKFLAVSQMEPTDARRAFPCFDEPNMKATFSVTLGRHRDMKSLSNMPLINSTIMDGKEDFFWDHFEKSVPMSTYLIAFVVADFTKVESDVYNSKWGFNIYARPSAKAQIEYAREIGPRIQAFFEDYFQVPYPLPKQDMIAIPDFSAGAMENWGLITYRENYLLYDANISSVSYKENIASVIAHELAHQWFGNLVTMDWWTDLWLNEGFATYIQYLGGEFAEPSFEWSQQMVLDTVQGVMGLDALESSHPINIIVHHPDEIAEIFDGISYSKG